MEMETLDEFRIASIKLQKVELKPKDLSKNSQFMVSNALVTSILKARFPPKHFLSSKFIASEVKAMQSLMFLPFMNPLCYVDTMFGRIVANLSAMIFVMTLNLKLARAIGLYCSIESADDLGINMIVLELKFGSIHPVVKN
jgi:hypothetical protein